TEREGVGEAGLAGADLTVGSKEFTEQLILGHMTILVLEDAGAQVDDQTGLVGSATVREALTSGQIDLYWEYTGTGWITHLGNTEPIPDELEQWRAVREADAANGVTWLSPAALNNTYAIATNGENFEEFEVVTLSDFATFVRDNPGQATLCAAAEFLGRDDGLPGLEQHYGFDIPPQNVKELELGIVYEAVGRADPCNFGEVFTTDGRIRAQDLVVLEDDKSFFPKYNAALNVRTEVFEQHPQLEELFAPLAAELTNDTMIELNSRVDVGGELPEEVAQDFLDERGLTGG
ncbi:MAG TPA: glycine betaine ABC transporter substrate-binding protein, partial [Egibacteraceae bacterium]|nr:glycine betaine ABC transporter substrate-binding protein [Egibacteraceae bacterium]